MKNKAKKSATQCSRLTRSTGHPSLLACEFVFWEQVARVAIKHRTSRGCVFKGGQDEGSRKTLRVNMVYPREVWLPWKMWEVQNPKACDGRGGM